MTPSDEPDEFILNQSYPDKGEVDVCRPIRLRIARNSRRFHEDLIMNTNPDIDFIKATIYCMSVSHVPPALKNLPRVDFAIMPLL